MKLVAKTDIGSQRSENQDSYRAGRRPDDAIWGAVCDGMAYLITPDVFAHLDHREKNGYLRLATEITFEDGSKTEGLVYIANEENAAFLGAASELDIARQIARSNGPSGPNSEYLLHLASALRELGKSDPHVFAIEQHLAQMQEQDNPAR